jgi:GNAT superfamily N-acetyltransferase
VGLKLRPFTLEDADVCGHICYEAFKKIDEEHGFPPSFESPESAAGFLATRAGDGFYGVVAEVDGRIVGSNFLDERSVVAGLGPISVDVEYQDGQIGRELMRNALERVTAEGFVGVRLTQSAFHSRSLSLYSKLGFVVREPLAVVKAQPLALTLPGMHVRSATEHDIEGCSRVCVRVHGLDRDGEVFDAVRRRSALVVERDGRITGYATGFGGGHAVAESNEDMKALIGAAQEFPGNGFLVPTRNFDLFTWCLEQGMRVVEPMTLMSLGLYQEPAGAFLPSFLF